MLVAAVVWALLAIVVPMTWVALSIACLIVGFLNVRDHNKKLALEAEENNTEGN